MFFMCRKIEIRRNVIFLVILFVNVEIITIFEIKVGPNMLPMFGVYHNHTFQSLDPPHLNTRN